MLTISCLGFYQACNCSEPVANEISRQHGVRLLESGAIGSTASMYGSG